MGIGIGKLAGEAKKLGAKLTGSMLHQTIGVQCSAYVEVLIGDVQPGQFERWMSGRWMLVPSLSMLSDNAKIIAFDSCVRLEANLHDRARELTKAPTWEGRVHLPSGPAHGAKSWCLSSPPDPSLLLAAISFDHFRYKNLDTFRDVRYTTRIGFSLEALRGSTLEDLARLMIACDKSLKRRSRLVIFGKFLETKSR